MTSPNVPTGRIKRAHGKEPASAGYSALGSPPPQNPSPVGATQMPGGWVKCPTSDVATLIRGVTYSKKDARKSAAIGYRPILRANNIEVVINHDDLVYVPSKLISANQQLRVGDILFAMSSGSRNLVGKSARITKDFDAGFGAFCGVLRPSAEIANEYLALVYQTREFRHAISEIAKGSNINNLKREHLLDFIIPLPPLAEQHRIVAKIEELFSELDAGEESLRLARKQLGVYRQSLLKQAFEGKLTKCLKIEKYALRSLITNLGQGWSPKCELNRPARPGEWAVIKTTAIQHCRYDDSEAKPLPSPFKPRPSIEIQDGDFLMTRKGPRTRAGVTCYVRSTRKRLMICDTVYRFRCVEEKVYPLYLELVLNSPDVLREIDRLKAGISESGLSLTHTKVGTVEIPLCSLPEQQEIVRLLDEQFTVIEQNEREIDAALKRSAALRQSILKKAFTGQLVPQDPTDEPASFLLERIRKERDDSRAKYTKKITSTKNSSNG